MSPAEAPEDTQALWELSLPEGALKEGEPARPLAAADQLLLDYLARHPGPAPSALEGTTLLVGGKPWTFAREDGFTALLDSKGRQRLHLGPGVSFQLFPAHQAVLSATVGASAPEGVALELIDLSKTLPIVLAAGAAPLGRAHPWRYSGEALLAKTLLPAALLGPQRPDLPMELRALGGTLSLLGDRRVGSAERRHHYLLDLEHCRVDVVDLPWYSDGGWQSGGGELHQFISRLVPAPAGPTFLAELVRGGVAELEPDRQRVRRWVTISPQWKALPTDFSAASAAHPHGSSK